MFLDDLIYKLEKIKYTHGGDCEVYLQVINNGGSNDGSITDIYPLETCDSYYKIIIESEN